MSEGADIEHRVAGMQAISDSDKTGAIRVLAIDCRGYDGKRFRKVDPHKVVLAGEELAEQKPDYSDLCHGCQKLYERDPASMSASEPAVGTVPGNILNF